VLARSSRAVPPLVWLVTALYQAVSLSQTMVFPNTRSPDERQHVDLIVKVATGEAWPWPAPGTVSVATGTGASVYLPRDRLPGPQHLADAAIPPRGERESYVEAGDAAPLEVTRDGRSVPLANQLVQHPPLYYLAGAAVLGLWPDWRDAPFDQVWMALRWANALLMVPMPLLVWATARRLRLPEPLPVAASMGLLAVPELTHLSSAVNNDNLLVLLMTAATALLARVLTRDHGLATAAALGAVTAAALLTKGFALLMPVWIGLAYLVAWYRVRSTAPLRALGVALLVAAPGLAWWVRNRIVYGALQPAGDKVTQTPRVAVYPWSDGGWHWLGRITDRFITTYFVQDHSGRMAMDASWWAAHVALALGVVGLVVTLVRRTLPRLDTLVLLVPTVAVAAIVGSASYQQFAATHLMAAQQGRYLFGGIAGALVVTFAGAAHLGREVRRLAPAAVLVFAAAMHAAFQLDTWQLYWMSPGGNVIDAARAVSRLYPFGLAVQAVVLGATAALAVGCAVGAVRCATGASPTAGRPLEDPTGFRPRGA
jgi:4-amino-4-deoxy-L-arabinose transferase-like glycosyltransferase